jgi:hypothetical protein
MSSSNYLKPIGRVWLGGLAVLLLLPPVLPGYEVFIYRRFDLRENLFEQKKITMHGELFGQLLSPSTFPSYNDLSGEEDRWNFGFHNYLLISASTLLHAQLITHDKNGERTKFDWHFSLRQQVVRNLTLEIGHDSDHDSDHTSTLRGKPFYTNRNYFGVYVPWLGKTFIVEPFLRFFYGTNQRVQLDLSGEKLRQELGLRLGASLGEAAALSFQVIAQSSRTLGGSETWLADLVLRVRLAGWIEATVGGGVWADRVRSPLGTKQTFTKLIWGIAIPF